MVRRDVQGAARLPEGQGLPEVRAATPVGAEQVSATERRKGARGELEVVSLFASYFPGYAIERAKGGPQAALDLVRVPGAAVSVKRHERLRLPEWIREADEAVDGLGLVPVVAYRSNRTEWRGDLPLRDLARYMARRPW